jgi:hypothetical protein
MNTSFPAWLSCCPLNSRRSLLVRCLLLLVVVSAAVTMTGCSFTVHEPRDAGVRRSTVGQELIDLKRAHESGAISDPEYETKKEELLSGGR